MKDWPAIDVVSTSLLGLSVVVGAVYGALAGGTILSVVVGAGIFGCFGLLALIVIGLVIAGIARLLDRRSAR
jgi:DMSO/TMAO reductase YedYZ heme-binding membrane subunit